MCEKYAGQALSVALSIYELFTYIKYTLNFYPKVTAQHLYFQSSLRGMWREVRLSMKYVINSAGFKFKKSISILAFKVIYPPHQKNLSDTTEYANNSIEKCK